jgi:hypothetical protein
MIKRILLLPITLLFVATSFAQNAEVKKPRRKGTLYAAWGYNKDFFSRSDLHFSNSGSDQYDFTLYNIKAVDRPGFSEILTTTLSVPQYVYRLGYFFNDKHNLGIEINFDHTKYVMVNSQPAHLKGVIHGKSYDVDTLVTPDFLKFEHTNGANFLMLNVIKKHELVRSKNGNHKLNALVKAGFGVVIPKTDVTLFGERLDNVFHIAGYVTGLDAGFRYEYKHFFSEATLKGTFANYNNVLTVGTGKADHTFFAGEIIWSAGFQIPI